ncbi:MULTISPECIES: SMODS domain-containing nucleotidyltransferase [Burkholderia]|uniref:SMODS domain-containing nucleotidyltransferase n=1 Tax=Burkholderia TaxID=32008 RepID=UPI0009E70802|nr:MULTISPECIES: nucleotidyltransferase [Burkholderia]MCS3400205.1 nucleotidyltransferase [Burkholderia thailandensis]MCS6508863.1 nucleotidyltransferase [Burkholderia thailandensis]QIO14913.1 nucleotidyltransferase [Burkholderia thailandensis]HDR9038415.1 nucleotidyltransferase [Burkholderia vietnamiensis]
MPRTIEQGFIDFHNKIKTSAVETAAAKSHRASIETCLRNNFGLNRFTRIGSFGNGTNVSGYSDVDYLACLPRSVLTRTSTASLVKVKNVLDVRFPNTGVKVSTPAVVCPFGTYKSEDTEIVVADYLREEKGFKVYDIADGDDGWMEASPDAHNHYVAEVDRKHGGKVKPLIRFIKAWKYYQNVPIKSFYLEMRVAKYANDEQTIIHHLDVKYFLDRLNNEGLLAMQDPMGVAGYIYPCKSDVQKTDALSRLNTAATRANKAEAARAAGNVSEAFDWWRLLYNDKFPTYYL